MPQLDNTVRWKRESAVSGGAPMGGASHTIWTTTIKGVKIEVANMQGQSVRYSGLGDHVLVWVDGRQVHSDYTVRDAKAWAVERYS